MTTRYLFGYGSLISTRNRSLTHELPTAHPATVLGFERGWCVHYQGITVLGVVANATAECHGVLVPLSDEAEIAIREREQGYDLVRVPDRDVDVESSGAEISEVWILVPLETDSATEEQPICQSYVDVVVSGCLEYGRDSADRLVKNTSGWKVPLFNDRAAPRYVRAMDFTQEELAAIDEVCAMIPDRAG